MAQKPVEIILMRQLASYLAVPIFLVDPAGTLLYYNEPAERLLGRRYEETGGMPLEEWSGLITLTDAAGTPLPFEERPLVIALRKHHVVHGLFWARGLDGVSRRIETTVFPLEGQGRRHLGAVAIFSEQARP